MRKIVDFKIRETESGHSGVFALADDGTMWVMSFAPVTPEDDYVLKWDPLPDLPQDKQPKIQFSKEAFLKTSTDAGEIVYSKDNYLKAYHLRNKEILVPVVNSEYDVGWAKAVLDDIKPEDCFKFKIRMGAAGTRGETDYIKEIPSDR